MREFVPQHRALHFTRPLRVIRRKHDDRPPQARGERRGHIGMRKQRNKSLAHQPPHELPLFLQCREQRAHRGVSRRTRQPLPNLPRTHLPAGIHDVHDLPSAPAERGICGCVRVSTHTGGFGKPQLFQPRDAGNFFRRAAHAPRSARRNASSSALSGAQYSRSRWRTRLTEPECDSFGR